MKFSPDIRRARRTGFTLPEILIAMTIFTALVGVIVALQIFGVRMYYLAATKLTATRDGRRTISFIREQVREAQVIYVGSYSVSGGSGIFSAIGDNTNQIGNALYTCPTNTGAFGTIFYQDQTSSNLCSVSFVDNTISANGLTFTGTINNLATNALFVTNSLPFQAEDFQGAVLKNNDNNRIIHVTLQFFLLEYPVVGIGAGQMYDYYELHTRATRRIIRN